MIKQTNPITSYGQTPSEINNLKVFIVVSKTNLNLIFINNLEPVAFQVFTYTIETADKIFEELSNSNYNTTLIFDNRLFSVMPNETLDESNKNQIASALFGVENHTAFISNKTAEFNFLFLVEDNFLSLINKYLPQSTLSHYSQLFMEYSMKEEREDEAVFFDIRDGFFYAALLKSKKLQLINSYQYSDKNEFGFFSLGAIKNLNFDAKKLHLHLSGALEQNSPLHQLLNRYLANISMLEIEVPNLGFMPFAQIIKYVKR